MYQIGYLGTPKVSTVSVWYGYFVFLILQINSDIMSASFSMK